MKTIHCFTLNRGSHLHFHQVMKEERMVHRLFISHKKKRKLNHVQHYGWSWECLYQLKYAKNRNTDTSQSHSSTEYKENTWCHRSERDWRAFLKCSQVLMLIQVEVRVKKVPNWCKDAISWATICCTLKVHIIGKLELGTESLPEPSYLLWDMGIPNIKCSFPY